MNKKNNNKGFTLVELIVVLVILAILAAILVPALLGYIDRAKEQQIVLNARSVMTAAQAQLTSKYAKDKDTTKVASFSEDDQIMIAKTADVPETASCAIYVKGGSAHGNYTLAAMSYTEGEKTVYFDGSSWDAPAIPTTGVTAVTNGSFTLKQSK